MAHVTRNSAMLEIFEVKLKKYKDYESSKVFQIFLKTLETIPNKGYSLNNQQLQSRCILGEFKPWNCGGDIMSHAHYCKLPIPLMLY